MESPPKSVRFGRSDASTYGMAPVTNPIRGDSEMDALDPSHPRHTRSARPARPGRRIAQQTADCDDGPAVRLPPGDERLERLVDIRVEGRAVEMGDDDRAAGAAALHGGDLALRRPAERVTEEAVRADRALP